MFLPVTQKHADMDLATMWMLWGHSAQKKTMGRTNKYYTLCSPLYICSNAQCWHADQCAASHHLMFSFSHTSLCFCFLLSSAVYMSKLIQSAPSEASQQKKLRFSWRVKGDSHGHMGIRGPEIMVSRSEKLIFGWGGSSSSKLTYDGSSNWALEVRDS